MSQQNNVTGTYPAWPPDTQVAAADPPSLPDSRCDLRELSRRVADATCYTRDHPQPIFYGRWNT